MHLTGNQRRDLARSRPHPGHNTASAVSIHVRHAANASSVRPAVFRFPLVDGMTRPYFTRKRSEVQNLPRPPGSFDGGLAFPVTSLAR
jgi:hypothetical protein